VSDAGTDAQQVASAAQPPPADPVPMLVPLPDPLKLPHNPADSYVLSSSEHVAESSSLTTSWQLATSAAGKDGQQVASVAHPSPADPVPMLVPLPDPLDAAHAGNSDR